MKKINWAMIAMVMALTFMMSMVVTVIVLAEIARINNYGLN